MYPLTPAIETEAGGTNNFTNVTIKSFLPDDKIIVPEPKLGQCLYTEVRNAKSWTMAFMASQLLSGLAVMLTQVPECVSYAYIAGVDPFHALQAAWIANVLTPILGGRPGLVYGPLGLGAVATRYVVSNYGQDTIFFVVLLSGFC